MDFGVCGATGDVISARKMSFAKIPLSPHWFFISYKRFWQRERRINIPEWFTFSHPIGEFRKISDFASESLIGSYKELKENHQNFRDSRGSGVIFHHFSGSGTRKTSNRFPKTFGKLGWWFGNPGGPLRGQEPAETCRSWDSGHLFWRVGLTIA